jgi:hypothetical protein
MNSTTNEAMSSADRVPCKTCGAQILTATANRNDGHCGRCAKGARPCIYCGQHVYEPLKGDVYAHMGCWMRHRQVEESLGWRTIEDIDWAKIQHVLRTALHRLFKTVIKERPTANPVTLVFCILIQDFIEISVYETTDNQKPLRLSSPDSQWDRDLSPFDASFSIMSENLNEQDSFDAAQKVADSLTALLSEECSALHKENFYFAKDISVSWTIKTDV